jgi:hypothetical protein
MNQMDINDLSSHSSQDGVARTDVSRIKRRFSTIMAAKNWLDIFFSIPPREYRGFIFSLNTQLVRCLASLVELATLDDAGWSKETVRSEVDIVATMDRIQENFEQAAPLLTTGGSENTFSIFCKFFRIARSYVATKLYGTTEAALARGSQDTGDGNVFAGLYDLNVLDNELFWDFSTANPYTVGSMAGS